MRVKLMRRFIIIGVTMLLMACNPEIESQIYVGDIKDASEGSEDIAFPMTLKVPILNIDDCQSEQQKFLPIIQKYSASAEFIDCQKNPAELYDFMQIRIYSEIVKVTSNSVDVSVQGFLALLIYQNQNSSLDTFLAKTDRVERVIEDLKLAYPVVPVSINDVQLEIEIINDLRREISIATFGFFIDGKPVAQNQVFALASRNSMDIQPSNVRVSKLLRTGSTYLASFGSEK